PDEPTRAGDQHSVVRGHRRKGRRHDVGGGLGHGGSPVRHVDMTGWRRAAEVPGWTTVAPASAAAAQRHGSMTVREATSATPAYSGHGVAMTATATSLRAAPSVGAYSTASPRERRASSSDRGSWTTTLSPRTRRARAREIPADSSTTWVPGL